MLKLTATQNVIRNKFRKIHANRLDHEQNVEQTLKPLEETTASTDNQSRLIIKLNSDPNAICDELRRLLLLSSHTNEKQSIDSILKELRDLDIIV